MVLDKAINWAALGIALFISCVSAFFSIIGLTTLFAQAFWSIVVMGTSLEMGKVATAVWLHRFGRDASAWMRTYLFVAVIALMAITSMGIFGYLSKAHIDQQLRMSSMNTTAVLQLDAQIVGKDLEVKDYDKQIAQLDDNITKMTTSGRTNQSLEAITKVRKDRDKLVKERKVVADEIIKLKTEKITANAEVKKIEAEVGPIKYLADLWYGQSTETELETAVKWVIVVLVLVFDPLAIVLIVASSAAIVTGEPLMKVIYRKRVGRPKGTGKQKLIKPLRVNQEADGIKHGLVVKGVSARKKKKGKVKVVNPPSLDLTKFSP